MPALWQSLYCLQPHLRLDQAWSNNAHVRFTEAAKSALGRWVSVLQMPPSRKIFLFSKHKGFWSGKVASRPYELPPDFVEQKHMFVPGEDPASPLAHLATDACPVSYGGYSGSERFCGRFDDKTLPMHINLKELLAIFYGVCKGAGHWWQACRLLVRCDNMTAVACVNRGSHILHHLDNAVSQITRVCHLFNIEIRAQHVPGLQNHLADDMSRLRIPAYTADWLLSRVEFERWEKMFGPPYCLSDRER